MFATTTATIVIVTLAIGLAPALHALASGARQLTPSLATHRTSGRIGRALIAIQVALSVILLSGAALFGRSLQNLLAIDAGVASDRLVSFRLDTSSTGYAPERAMALARDVTDRLARLPGVMSASYADIPLLGGTAWRSAIAR